MMIYINVAYIEKNTYHMQVHVIVCKCICKCYLFYAATCVRKNSVAK